MTTPKTPKKAQRQPAHKRPSDIPDTCMREVVTWYTPEEYEQVKTLARATNRTIPGIIRTLLLEGLRGMDGLPPDVVTGYERVAKQKGITPTALQREVIVQTYHKWKRMG